MGRTAAERPDLHSDEREMFLLLGSEYVEPKQRPLSIPGDLPVRTTTQSKQPISHNKLPKVLYSFIELTKQCFQNQEKYTPMHINTGYGTSEMWFG